MARVERISATTPVPVEQAQLIDPSDFRFSTAGAEAFKAIGGVLEELGRRKVEMQDRIGISNINAAMENAEREYQKDIIDKPLEEHAAILQKHRNNAMSFAAQQRLSADTRTLAENKLGIWSDSFADAGEIATIKAIERDAIIRVTSDYEKALTEGIREDITEAEIVLDGQFEISYEPAEAKVLKEKAEQRAIKQMEENAKQNLMNRAAIKPNLIISAIDVALKERAKGKKAFDEFALLSNTDLEAIRDYAGSVGEKVATDSAVATSAAIEDSYAKIASRDTDITSMITAIQTNPTISDDDSSRAVDKIVTFFSKFHSAKVADISNEDVYDELTQASESVERGALSPAAFEELYVDKKHLLTREDQRAIRSKDIVATKTMQNRAFTDAMSATLPTLVELTESDLGAIKLARQNAEIIKDIATVNMFNIAIKKNQAERWNYGRFRKQLRSQIDQNPEWSQKQIFVAQEILTDQLDIPVAQLLKEFDAQNPNKAIMKTPPNIQFKDIWPDLSIDDKAKIWELTMRGAPPEVILGEIPEKPPLRPSGSPKGVGFLGELKLPGGGIATEFSVGTTDVTGEELNIPTLVPTLTKKEIELMVNDIIPNKKKVPDAIFKKAVAHAKKRIKQGKSVFFERGE